MFDVNSVKYINTKQVIRYWVIYLFFVSDLSFNILTRLLNGSSLGQSKFDMTQY